MVVVFPASIWAMIPMFLEFLMATSDLCACELYQRLDLANCDCGDRATSTDVVVALEEEGAKSDPRHGASAVRPVQFEMELQAREDNCIPG